MDTFVTDTIGYIKTLFEIESLTPYDSESRRHTLKAIQLAFEDAHFQDDDEFLPELRRELVRLFAIEVAAGRVLSNLAAKERHMRRMLEVPALQEALKRPEITS